MKLKLVAILLLGFVSIVSNANSLNSLRDEILQSIKKYDAKIGVAVMINDTDTMTVNNHEKYPMMSVFKFHQSLAVCDYMQKNGMSLGRILTVLCATDIRKETSE